jgi:hypothetical protein
MSGSLAANIGVTEDRPAKILSNVVGQMPSFSAIFAHDSVGLDFKTCGKQISLIIAPGCSGSMCSVLSYIIFTSCHGSLK